MITKLSQMDWTETVNESDSVTLERIRSRKSGEEFFELLKEEAQTFTTDESRQRFWTLLACLISDHARLTYEAPVKTADPIPRQYQPMSKDEAKMFELHLIKFGKHNGKTVGQVDLDYLRWLDEDEFRWKLHRYLKSDRVLKEEASE